MGGRILHACIVHQPVQRLHLHAEVVGAVGEAEPLAKPHGMQNLRRRLPVVFDRRFGDFPVHVEPLLVADIPHAIGRVAVFAAFLRKERRLDLLQERDGRARIPVAHRAEILRNDQTPVAGGLQHLLAERPAVFERPEKRTVVVARHRLGDGLGGIGIRNLIRESLLEQIVLSDAEHDRVDTRLHAPIELAVPVGRSPMLSLEARQTTVREVADAAVGEARDLVLVQSVQTRSRALRHHVSIPEPAAAAATLEEIVDGIERAPSVDGGDGKTAGDGLERVGVAAVLALRHLAENDCPGAVAGNGHNRRLLAANLLPIALQLVGRTAERRHPGNVRRQHDLERSLARRHLRESLVGERKHPSPVVRREAVVSAPVDIAQMRSDARRIEVRRERLLRESRLAQKFPDGTGRLACQILSARIEPFLVEPFNQKMAGSHACQQHVLVEWNRLVLRGIGEVRTREPVGKRLGLRFDVFAVIVLYERSAAVSSLVRHHHLKAGIVRTGKQCGLSEPRTARHDRTRSVYPRLLLGKVESPAESPSPGHEALRVVRRGLIPCRPQVEAPPPPFRRTIFLLGRIGCDVKVACRHHRITAGDNIANGPVIPIVRIAPRAAQLVPS